MRERPVERGRVNRNQDIRASQIRVPSAPLPRPPSEPGRWTESEVSLRPQFRGTQNRRLEFLHPNGRGLGEVPKRSNGADCKSAGSAFGGSNPPLSTTLHPCRDGADDRSAEWARSELHGPFEYVEHVEPVEVEHVKRQRLEQRQNSNEIACGKSERRTEIDWKRAGGNSSAG